MQVRAKPLEWNDNRLPNGDLAESYDKVLGFGIVYDGDDSPHAPFRAWWGEDEPENFATEGEAKEWCQQQANRFVSDIATVVTH